MAGAKSKPNKTSKRMRKQSDDLLVLAALGNGESGNSQKDLIGSLPKWLDTLKEGYTKLTKDNKDVPYNGELPKFSIKVIAGAGADVPVKSTTKKR